MHDAELDIGCGIRRDRIGQTGESVATQNQNVLHATGFQIVEDLQPEACAFGFFDPKPENFLAAADADTEHGVDTFLQHAFVGADGNPQTIDKDDG